MKLIICCWWFLGFQLKDVRTHAKRFTAVDLSEIRDSLKMSSQTVAPTTVCSTHIPRWTGTCSFCTQTPHISSWKQHNYQPSTAIAVKLRVHFGFNFIPGKQLNNVSCEYNRLNGWNSTLRKRLQAAWYFRHVRVIRSTKYGFCELNLRYDH